MRTCVWAALNTCIMWRHVTDAYMCVGCSYHLHHVTPWVCVWAAWYLLYVWGRAVRPETLHVWWLKSYIFVGAFCVRTFLVIFLFVLWVQHPPSAFGCVRLLEHYLSNLPLKNYPEKPSFSFLLLIVILPCHPHSVSLAFGSSFLAGVKLEWNALSSHPFPY